MRKEQKILLIDDDPIFLTLAELAIKKERSNVLIYKAGNGEEAIKFLADEIVDLIFLDLNMPVMNGWEFLDTVDKKENLKDKIYILTSSIDPTDRRKAISNPLVISMLEKPLDKVKIDQTIPN